MTTEPKDSGKQEQSKPDAQTADLKIARASLIASAPDYLGVERHVAAGALHGEDGPLSVRDAEAKIKSWLDKPVERED